VRRLQSHTQQQEGIMKQKLEEQKQQYEDH